jgi:hypothetical protein
MMDEETAGKRESFIRKHWPLMIVLTLALAPGIWGLLVFIYNARIDGLNQQLRVSEERRLLCEDRLRAETPDRAVGVPPSQSPPSAGGAAGSGSAPKPAGETRLPGRYPNLENPEHPTQDDVRRLAEFYDLLKPWPTNPHLRFKTGDISYWREQGFSATDLEREFESRRLVLDRAERSGKSIPSQGDLSHAAELLQSQMPRVGRPTSR